MYTITHCWINNEGNIPEANCSVNGLYDTMEEAKKGLHLWFMKVPNNGCEIFKVTDEMYYFLSPDGKTKGYVEIQKVGNL